MKTPLRRMRPTHPIAHRASPVATKGNMSKSKNKSVVVNVPVETVGPVAGQVLLPDSITYVKVSGGMQQHQNYQLPVGKTQAQYTEDGVTWVNSGDPRVVTSPGEAWGFPIPFPANVGWQLVFLGA